MKRRLGACQHGLSLVEVLIGITLLSLTLSIVYSALFGVSKQWATVQHHQRALDDQRLVTELLRRQLEKMRSVVVRSEREARFQFDGRIHEVLFVGELPAHRGEGGLQLLWLHEHDNALILDWQFVSTTSRLDDPPPHWRTEQLLEDIDGIQFSYFGPIDQESPAIWHNRWQRDDRLPELIRIAIDQGQNRQWPSIVIPVRQVHGQPAPPQLIVQRDP